MLLIYLPKISQRCNYIFDYIFKNELGIEYTTTTDITEFERFPREKINYSFSPAGSGFFIKASSLLFENEIKEQKVNVAEKEAVKVLFPGYEDDLGFDIFSASFFLMSRYEEYLPYTPDEFGRFPAEESLAFRKGFLQLPVVNIWIKMFREALQKKFPLLQIKRAIFNAILTYDIDVAYKFKGRTLARTFGSVAKDISGFNFKDVVRRIETLSGAEKDPWDVYDDLKKIIFKNKIKSIFFFLLSDKTKYDRNLNYQNDVMKDLISRIKEFSEFGIHPSFYSSVSSEKILIEKERLENISGRKITKSRQHFLKFKLPDTYNSLLSAGITEDYSMGFSKLPGFRAGTCKPFYFYDLKSEKTTDLKIFPVTFMEGTLMNDLQPEDASQKISQLLKEVSNVGGTFISLWHNHTVSKTREYLAWRNVHQKMIDEVLFTLSAS
ncbi:MAG TPA: polysaccharide deacetylase family protein [Hanamia sp.]|nr:polysaccharide deacetylase family protein [Hanamia sp.]